VTRGEAPKSPAPVGRDRLAAANGEEHQWTPVPGVRRRSWAERFTAGGARPSEQDGWAILSYLVAGMVIYGGIGWLIGWWTHLPWLFGIGMVVGVALGTALVIFRVSRF
jgi:hypothetical protein